MKFFNLKNTVHCGIYANPVSSMGGIKQWKLRSFYRKYISFFKTSVKLGIDE